MNITEEMNDRELMVLKDKAMLYDKIISAFRNEDNSLLVYEQLYKINEEAKKYGI